MVGNSIFVTTLANPASGSFIVSSKFVAPTGIATSPGPYPARNLTGFQKKVKFPFETELYNQLNWTASFGVATVAYKVYRNGTLIATVPATQLQFEDHDRKRGVSYFYEVFSVNAQGITGPAATLTLP